MEFILFSTFVVITCILMGRRIKATVIKCMSFAVLVIYLAFVLLTTLIARTPMTTTAAKWIPLWSWYEVIFHHDSGLFIEICQNLVMLMPVGAMLNLLKGISAKQAAVIGLIITATIEFLQLVTHRGLFEWDDILHNSIGCVVGALIPVAIRKMRKRLQTKRV